MNDEEHTPIAMGDEADQVAGKQELDSMETEDYGSRLSDDAAADIRAFNKASEPKVEADAKPALGEMNIEIPVEADSATEDAPDEELSDLEKELGRVEGIESAVVTGSSVVAEEKVDTVVASDENEGAREAVDLDPVTPDAAQKESPLVAAMRKQEKSHGKKKRKIPVVSLVLGLLLLGALGATGFLYMQTTSLASENKSLANERDELVAKNVDMKTQQAKVREQAFDEARKSLGEGDKTKGSQVALSEYVVIDELGVQYKKTAATDALIYGYTVVTSDPAVDSVAFSTKTLAHVVQSSGASAVYPCLFTGSVPTIARYAQDAPVGDSTASKVGKKLGDAYYVYTPAIGACAQTNATDIAARDAAVKAVYESLESVPVVEATSTAQ